MLRFGGINLGAIALLALALSGCGGGGGDGGGDGGGTTTFTVGGTVTGLSGSVVLQLNGGNDLTVNAPGSFNFATELNDGASYTVTIIRQPSTQVCGPGATNGTGTISGADVTNVAIDCADYSIGGTVSGLTADGLVLRLNGVNDLAVAAASADFTFPASVSLGGIIYSLHIQSQPAGQTCTIVDSTGIVTAGAPDALGAAVACVDNATDPLSGIYMGKTLDGQPISGFRPFLAFYPDGTYIFAVHEDDPTCGASGHGGIEYGVYSWDQDTHEFAMRTPVLDTNGECGISNGDALSGALVVNTDGTLTVSDSEGTFTLEAVPSTAGTLLGGWGDNQAFLAFNDDGTVFLASTRAILQVPNTSIGIEDACYELAGTTASGSYTVDFTASCAVDASQTAVDTTGVIGFSALVGHTVDVSVTGDAMQTTVEGVPALAIVPGTRINATALPASVFTVSGTIKGLTGTGLGLRLNDDAGATFNVSPTAGATNFAFAAQLHAGDAYRVTFVGEPANPTQLCLVTGGLGGIIGASTPPVTINCVNSGAYSANGAVSGLTGAGLSLHMSYSNIMTGVSGSTDLPLAANGAFAFPASTVPANNLFTIGIGAQPAGQTCAVSRARGFSVGPDIANLGVVCLDNTTDPLSGTYSFVNDEGRQYFNFNADGTFTTVMVHNDPDCNTTDDTRNGNGVEYGFFSWDQATDAFAVPAAPVVDTNGGCGFADSGDFQDSFAGFVSRVGDGIELREPPGGGAPLFTAPAVESVARSLVGAFVPEANNGMLLVFQSDGTFLWVETQLNGSFPLGYGQERGCYTVSGSTVMLSLNASCRPDGFDAYDFNGASGLFPNGVTLTGPWPFTFDDPDTLRMFGLVFKRTHPN